MDAVLGLPLQLQCAEGTAAQAVRPDQRAAFLSDEDATVTRESGPIGDAQALGERDPTVAELPISITVAAQTLAPLQSTPETYDSWGITQFIVTVERMTNLPVVDCRLLRDGIDVGAPDEILETPHVSDRTPGARPETEGITVVFYDVSSFQRCSPGSDCTVHYLLSCSCLPGSGSDLTALVDVISSVGGPLADGEPSVKRVRIEARSD